MRQLFIVVVGLAVAGLCAGPALAGKVEVKGSHVCCMQCVNQVKAVLGKVDGVSDAAAAKGQPITFTAKDEKATAAGVKALMDAGFAGTATDDGKEVKVELTSPKAGEKADEVSVKSVHICCMQCKNTVTKLFKDATVTFADEDKTTKTATIKVAGKDLEKAKVLEELRKAGYNGSIEK
jgi:copper chaperone CopZ